MPFGSYDRLTGQLYYLPSIIERLGLGIAEAQKGLNEDYLTGIGRIMEMIKPVLEGADENKAAILQELIKSLAPSRYQFTETTLTFRADLSETMDLAGTLGGGAGLGAVMVKASLAIGFGYDYRAAAEVTTVLHAIPTDEKLMGTLLQNKPSAPAGLPSATEVDQGILDSAKAIAAAVKAGQAVPPEGG